MIDIISKSGNSGVCRCSQCRAEYSVKYLSDARKSPIGDLCENCKNSIHSMGEITPEKLHKVFNYDPETGILTYKTRSKNFNPGDVANYTVASGYQITRINGIDYLAHRIIYLYMTGKWPELTDHINHNRSDNRWKNLREVSERENALNTSLSKNSSTGINGVALHKPTGKYRAYINIQRKQIHLGLFNTIEEAQTARKLADTQYKYHENHGSPAV
jgi:hypothetical protein